MDTATPTRTESPATLVAIIVAAHRIGDRDLEREMKRRLADEHGVTLRFARQKGACR